MGPERTDIRPKRPDRGNEQMDGQPNKQRPPVFYRTLVPFGAAAQKGRTEEGARDDKGQVL